MPYFDLIPQLMKIIFLKTYLMFYEEEFLSLSNLETL